MKCSVRGDINYGSRLVLWHAKHWFSMWFLNVYALYSQSRCYRQWYYVRMGFGWCPSWREVRSALWLGLYCKNVGVSRVTVGPWGQTPFSTHSLYTAMHRKTLRCGFPVTTSLPVVKNMSFSMHSSAIMGRRRCAVACRLCCRWLWCSQLPAYCRSPC